VVRDRRPRRQLTVQIDHLQYRSIICSAASPSEASAVVAMRDRGAAPSAAWYLTARRIRQGAQDAVERPQAPPLGSSSPHRTVSYHIQSNVDGRYSHTRHMSINDTVIRRQRVYRLSTSSTLIVVPYRIIIVVPYRINIVVPYRIIIVVPYRRVKHHIVCTDQNRGMGRRRQQETDFSIEPIGTLMCF
jgi:hypothetical protein